MESKKNINISGKKNICGLLFINETAIEIETRSNINHVNDFGNINYYRKRAACENWNLPAHSFTHSHQCNIISKLYMNLDNDVIENRDIYIKEITKKLSGYKRQDTDKQIYSKDIFISLEDVIDKLLCSKLKCFYCKCECELIYENILSKHQWTLDRIENDAGHNTDNVVICCLECNLKRGTMDSGRFKYGKQLKFKKVG
jgi:5-methylcytosine-specific restriction endonuclease McrA